MFFKGFFAFLGLIFGGALAAHGVYLMFVDCTEGSGDISMCGAYWVFTFPAALIGGISGGVLLWIIGGWIQKKVNTK